MSTVLDDIRRLERLPAVQHLDRTASQSSVGGILGRLDQLVCGLTGHDELMRFEPDRLSLLCSQCGHQSAGWQVRSPRVDVVAKPANPLEGSHILLHDRNISSLDQRPMLERVT